jgi:hypothetical protein
VWTQKIYTKKLIVCLHRAREYLLRSNVRNLLLFADDINYTLLKNCSQCGYKQVSSAPFIIGVLLLEQWTSESSISAQPKGNWWAFERDSRSIIPAHVHRQMRFSLYVLLFITHLPAQSGEAFLHFLVAVGVEQTGRSLALQLHAALATLLGAFFFSVVRNVVHLETTRYHFMFLKFSFK